MRTVYGILTLLLAASASAQSLKAPSIDGRKQVTAVRANGPITIDGVLDEAVWAEAPPAVDFIQADPNEGQPATETTDVRVAFDDQNLYIGAVCRDSHPSGIVVNDIRKDFADREQDTFEVLLDTFADRRNGFVFVTNAEGARADTQMASEGREVNPSWDAVWWVNARRTPEGWTVEFRIPFKTLRFRAGEGRIWGINFARRIRRKNEVSRMSSASRGSGTRRRMKRRKRNFSRSTTSAICWSFTYSYRRIREANIVRECPSDC